MTKENAKKLFKAAVLIYLASFFIINWNEVSWIFNYKEVIGLVEDFFNPYPSLDASTINDYFYPNHSQDLTTTVKPSGIEQPAAESATKTTTAQSQNTLQNVSTSYTDKQDILEVPKLSLNLPIVFADSTDAAAMAKYLDLGVVYYPGSVYPGQTGQIAIVGHSAPPGWPHIKHDWAFTDLDKLSPGDTIYIDINNKQYKYIVREKNIIKKGSAAPADTTALNGNVLTLLSCWPPGYNYERMAVTADLAD